MTYPDDELEAALLDGWATLMAAQIPGLFYSADPAVPYPADRVGIYVDRYPETEQPSISLTDYVVSDDVSDNGDDVVGVQAMIWHQDRDELRKIRGQLRSLFHRRGRTTLSGVTLVLATRESGTNVGQDENGRQGRTENYYATVSRYATN